MSKKRKKLEMCLFFLFVFFLKSTRWWRMFYRSKELWYTVCLPGLEIWYKEGGKVRIRVKEDSGGSFGGLCWEIEEKIDGI